MSPDPTKRVAQTPYRRYQQSLMRLHRLNVLGQLDSPEADDVRDEMEGEWDALNDVERRRLAGLSADLYSLAGEELPEGVDKQAFVELEVTFRRGDWESVLLLLRRTHSLLSPVIVAYMRGRCWERLGDPLAAAWFYSRAHELDPADETYEFMALSALLKAEQRTEVIERTLRHLANPTAPPRTIFAAANILVQAAQELPALEAKSIYGQIVSPLRNAIDQEQPSTGSRLNSLAIGAWFHLALSLEGAGDLDAAAETYLNAIKLFPDSDELVAAQALFFFRLDRNAEVWTLLDELVDRRTAIVHPYLLLARRALLEQQFSRCLELCSQGIRLTTRDDHLADLLEWAAIAQAELGLGKSIVHETFQRALSHDPMNSRIRSNLAAFEHAVSATEAARRYDIGAKIPMSDLQGDIANRLQAA